MFQWNPMEFKLRILFFTTFGCTFSPFGCCQHYFSIRGHNANISFASRFSRRWCHNDITVNLPRNVEILVMGSSESKEAWKHADWPCCGLHHRPAQHRSPRKHSLVHLVREVRHYSSGPGSTAVAAVMLEEPCWIACSGLHDQYRPIYLNLDLGPAEKGKVLLDERRPLKKVCDK